MMLWITFWVTLSYSVSSFYFIPSGLKIISHGNPDNNLESPCSMIIEQWTVKDVEENAHGLSKVIAVAFAWRDRSKTR
jgi:hypothetical protein